MHLHSRSCCFVFAMSLSFALRLCRRPASHRTQSRGWARMGACVCVGIPPPIELKAADG